MDRTYAGLRLCESLGADSAGRERRLEDLLRCCLVELYRERIAVDLREEIEPELARKEGHGY